MKGKRVGRRTLLARGGAFGAAGALGAACGAGGGTPAPAGGSAETVRGQTRREVTVRWSTWGDDKHPFNTEAVPQGLRLFSRAFPNIKVSPEPQIGASDAWAAKHQAEWQAGVGPDLAGHCCSVGLQWGRDGLLLDLAPLVKRDVPQRTREDYPEWLSRLFTLPGVGQIALPMYSGTVALFYNKALFGQKGVAPPTAAWDWDRYREAALKLNDPAAGVFGRRQVRGYDRLTARLHQAGGGWVDPQDGAKPAFDRPEAALALQYERDANLKDRYTAAPGDAAGLQGVDVFGAVSARRLAMWEDGAFALLGYATQVEREAAAQWDVAPLPAGPKGRATLATHDGWSLWKGSKVTDEAWELLKFLQGEEWTDLAARVAGQQPARKSLQERWVRAVRSAFPALADKNLKPFTDAVAEGFARPQEFFAKRQAESVRAINDLLNGAVYSAGPGGAIRNGEVPLEAALKTAAGAVAALQR